MSLSCELLDNEIQAVAGVSFSVLSPMNVPTNSNFILDFRTCFTVTDFHWKNSGQTALSNAPSNPISVGKLVDFELLCRWASQTWA